MTVSSASRPKTSSWSYAASVIGDVLARSNSESVVSLEADLSADFVTKMLFRKDAPLEAKGIAEGTV